MTLPGMTLSNPWSRIVPSYTVSSPVLEQSEHQDEDRGAFTCCHRLILLGTLNGKARTCAVLSDLDSWSNAVPPRWTLRPC